MKLFRIIFFWSFLVLIALIPTAIICGMVYGFNASAPEWFSALATTTIAIVIFSGLLGFVRFTFLKDVYREMVGK